MKSFKRKEQLTLHIVIHSGEKKHVCIECGKGKLEVILQKNGLCVNFFKACLKKTSAPSWKIPNFFIKEIKRFSLEDQKDSLEETDRSPRKKNRGKKNFLKGIKIFS